MNPNFDLKSLATVAGCVLGLSFSATASAESSDTTTYTSPDGVTYEVATADVDAYDVVEPTEDGSKEVYEPEPAYVTDEAPPERVAVHVVRPHTPWPGAIWVNPYWWWDGYSYVWITGHYVRPHGGFVFVSPRWDFFGGYWSFVPGYYRPHWALPVYYHSYYHPYYRSWGHRWNHRHHAHRRGHGSHRRGRGHHRATNRTRAHVNTTRRTHRGTQHGTINKRGGRNSSGRSNSVRRTQIQRRARIQQTTKVPHSQRQRVGTQRNVRVQRNAPQARRKVKVQRTTPRVKRGAPRAQYQKGTRSNVKRSSVRKVPRPRAVKRSSLGGRSKARRSSSFDGRSSARSVRRGR